MDWGWTGNTFPSGLSSLSNHGGSLSFWFHYLPTKHNCVITAFHWCFYCLTTNKPLLPTHVHLQASTYKLDTYYPIYQHTYLPRWPFFTNRIGYQGETWLQLSWDSSTTESSQTSNRAFTTCLLTPTSLHLCTDHLHAFTYQVATCYPYIPI